MSTTLGILPVEARVLANLVVDPKMGEVVDQPNWTVSSYPPLSTFLQRPGQKASGRGWARNSGDPTP